MVQYHWDLHKRKRTGGKKRPWRKKRKYELGSDPVKTIVGSRKIKIEKITGGNYKIKVLSEEYANVLDPETKSCKKVRIVRVERNPADKNYDREGIITKGAVILTEVGRAVVTSRPGQDGVVNAVLIRP